VRTRILLEDGAVEHGFAVRRSAVPAKRRLGPFRVD